MNRMPRLMRAGLIAAMGMLLALLQGCATAPSQTAAVVPGALPAPANVAPAPTVDTLGLVAYAASMQGKPYVMGGQTPQQGFDCSGLVYHVFKQFNYELPRNALVMADELPEVSLSQLRAADLVFFNTQGTRYGHVGIYLGDGRFVHAPSPRTGRVIISNMDNVYWNGHLVGARRPHL